MTDEIHRPVETFSRKRNLRKKIVAILWDAHQPEINGRPSREIIDETIFGANNSVRQFFLENSNGYFTIERAATLGWYEADYSAKEYWPPKDEDGNRPPGRDSGREAIIKASVDFDFKQFDVNNNNKLIPEELGIVFLLPGNHTGGLNRVVGADYTTRDTATGIRINGLLIQWIIEARVCPINNPNNIGVMAHELSHLLLGHGDMYFDVGPVCTAAGGCSLMDQHNPAPHIDPFGKLKFGWLKPEIIFSSGVYSLQNIEKSQKAYLLIHPDKGMDEYYIIENRFSNTNYDRHLEFQGLAVWHITEKKELYRHSVPPKNVTLEEWNDPKNDGLSRKGIRLIKPHPTRDINNRKLWDGAFPERSYPLTSINNNPNRSALVWSDGSPSGFTIKNFSPAGETMTFQVIVPF